MDSILTSIKKLLGISEEYTSFDQDIIMHINSVFSILTQQFGVGPSSGFSIEDDSVTWSDFIEDRTKFELIKTYIYMKVRLVFDPPTNSVVMESIKNTISELEWRITAIADTK